MQFRGKAYFPWQAQEIRGNVSQLTLPRKQQLGQEGS